MKRIFRCLGIICFYLFPSVLFATTTPKTETAVFAGGCFWCMTPPFEELKGVLKVTTGYTDGKGKNPAYGDYAEKGYTEGVQITFDSSQVSYERLLEVFWRQINPTDSNGQFADRGPQYRAAVFYLNEYQKKQAEKSKKDLGKSGKFDKPILVPIKKYMNFYPAEDYHQDFYKKNPVHYRLYHMNSGRESFLEKVWAKH